MTARTHILALVALAGAVAAAGCSGDVASRKQARFERAEQYAGEGRYNEAIIEYRAAIQLDAAFGRARARLAEAYLRTQNVSAAYGEYVRAADLLPDDLDVQLAAGNMLLMAGRFEDAARRAEQALAIDQDNPRAYVVLGCARAGLKDLDGAVAQIERAIQEDPHRGMSYATLASFELMRGNRAAANAAFEKALEVEPDSVTALLALGNYRLTIGDRAGARQAFSRAADAEPDNVLALRSLAGLYLAARELDEAEPVLRRLADRTKDEAAAFLLAEVLLARGRQSEATELLTVVSSNPSDRRLAATAKLRLAVVEYLAGHMTTGHTYVDDVLAAEPKSAQALTTKGRFLLHEGRLQEAADQLRSAVAADGRYEPGYFWLAEVSLRRRNRAEAQQALGEVLRLTPAHVPAQVEMSRLQLAAGNADMALDYAERAAAARPDDPLPRMALVRALAAKGSLPRAQQEFERLARGREADPRVQVLEGQLNLARRNPQAATVSFRRALDREPAAYDALYGLVQSRLAAGDVTTAVAEATAAVRRAPADATAQLIAARTYMAARDYARAEETLRQVIDADAQNLDAYAMLGFVYAVQGRTDDAAREFDAVARGRPKDVAALTMAGVLYEGSNRRAEAKERYRKALGIDPRSAVAANNLAWLETEDGENLDVALQRAQTAKAMLPNSPQVNDTLGWIYYKKGLFTAAISVLQESVSRAPQVAQYHYRLGLAYAKVGEIDKARESLTRSLKIDAAFEGSEEARAALAGLP